MAPLSNIELILSDIENGTAIFSSGSPVKPTAAPKIASTPPAPKPSKNAVSKRAALEDRSANHSTSPRQKTKGQARRNGKNNDKKIDDEENEASKSLSQQSCNTAVPIKGTTKDISSTQLRINSKRGKDDKGNEVLEDSHQQGSDTIRKSKHYKSTSQQQKQQEQSPAQLRNQEYIPSRVWDPKSGRWWRDCGYCRGAGRGTVARPWSEHDRQGAHKRVDAHNKNIKMTCIHCQFYGKQYDMPGRQPE
ncbi:hypothetical protein FKW77_007450 [Venturia effusa]|uniref:Uncharacterized protein n=1 Tax=Venturia effusa TaxID=50376 RepID=A0A517LHL6_9PEZI|nr:hypothetical protein FKW77_007450 [Venturia effusa]